MSETLILQEFKNNLITFFDELIDQFPTEADLVIIRIFLKDRQLWNRFTSIIILFSKNE